MAELTRAMARDHAHEVWDVSGLTPEAALRLSFAASLEAYVFLPTGSAGVLFAMGVAERGLLDNSAMVWLLGAERMRCHTVGLLRSARWGLRRAFTTSGAEYLVQYIPDWYDSGLRFAVHLGFAAEQTGLQTRHGSQIYRMTLFRNACGGRTEQ